MPRVRRGAPSARSGSRVNHDRHIARKILLGLSLLSVIAIAATSGAGN
ncbi:MAG: hypothetical protein M3478_09760 [Planctomycetota bacterium]|nr:hypothetical protein [Planctomycetota bacterium]